MLKHLMLIAAVLVAPTVAHAELYGVVRGGIVTDASVGPLDLSDGSTFGVGVGGAVGPVRVEASLDHANFDVFPGVTATADTVAVTGNLDFQVTPDSTISVGAGPAWTRGEANFLYGSADDSGFGYVAQGSYSHRINDRMIGEVQVRYTKADFDSIPDGSDVAVTAGVRFRL